MLRLTNKTAFITGGNSGIGLAAARLFVAEGARVAITGPNQKTLRAAAAELGDLTSHLSPLTSHLSLLESSRRRG